MVYAQSMRPKSTARDLPPRMLRRTRKLVSGKVWVGYYYAGRDESGKRVEIPLGTDLNEAKRKWAELECKPVSGDLSLLCHTFDRYEREVIPTKAAKTQLDNLGSLKKLRIVFDKAPIDAITPQHIARYRDERGKKAPVRANREISLFSHIWNMAREWGYTAKENPVRGVRKNKETPRDYYAEDQVWQAVYDEACVELQDAMDINYLSGQRPADVLKLRLQDINDDFLMVQQGKTGKKLRIMLRVAGVLTDLGAAIERIKSRPRNVVSMFLIATPEGRPLNKGTRRTRFDAARAAAAAKAEANEDHVLAAQIRAFQFRDIRPKAATDMEDLTAASKLLGHTEEEITKKVYIRKGEKVMPTR
ncbi:MAG: tyrosine-type recombinase/integrase [Porticoccaceae bacterium]